MLINFISGKSLTILFIGVTKQRRFFVIFMRRRVSLALSDPCKGKGWVLKNPGPCICTIPFYFKVNLVAAFAYCTCTLSSTILRHVFTVMSVK